MENDTEKREREGGRDCESERGEGEEDERREEREGKGRGPKIGTRPRLALDATQPSLLLLPSLRVCLAKRRRRRRPQLRGLI